MTISRPSVLSKTIDTRPSGAGNLLGRVRLVENGLPFFDLDEFAGTCQRQQGCLAQARRREADPL